MERKVGLESLQNGLQSRNKLRTYRKLKEKFEIENFLKLDIGKTDMSNFMRIRISNSNLMIEKGRHKKLSVDLRICPLLQMGCRR